jgi:hypothetical protein
LGQEEIMDKHTLIRIRRQAKAAEACDDLGLAAKLKRDMRKAKECCKP